MTVKGGSNMNMAWVKRRFLAFPSVSARVFTLVVTQARLPLKFNTSSSRAGRLAAFLFYVLKSALIVFQTTKPTKELANFLN